MHIRAQREYRAAIFPNDFPSDFLEYADEGINERARYHGSIASYTLGKVRQYR